MTNKHYIKGIDGLRAFAVLAVMLFHIYPQALPGGFTGVDVFFVISGYVVSSSLAKNYRSNFLKYTIDFYARRILRLVPVLLVFLLVVVIFTTLFIPSSWLSETTSKTALAAFFGYSNFALVWYNDSYFSPRIEFNPFVHTWSLSVEEQFYVLFPLIFYIWYRFRNHHSRYLSFIAKWLLTTLLIVSIVYSWYLTTHNPEEAFYLLPDRFWELALGALLFKLHIQNKLVYSTNRIHTLFQICGMALIIFGFYFSDKNMFPFPWAIFPTVGAMMLIIGFVNNHNDESIIKSIFENRAMVYIGKISYSLYLWHWAIYALFRWTVGLETILQMLAAVALTIFFSVLSYNFIEKPFRSNQFIRHLSNWKIVLFGLLAIYIAYSGSKYIFENQSIISLSVTKDKKTWYPHAYHAVLDENFETKQDFSKHKLFVLGDSHTGAYSTMLQKLSDEYYVKVFKFSSGGCGVADFHTVTSSKGAKCIKYINDVVAKINSIAAPGDILFLASLRVNRLCDQYTIFSEKIIIADQLSEAAENNRRLIIDETGELIKQFEKKGMRIIIDAPKPVFKAPAFRCSDWFNKSNPICKGGLTMKRDFLLEFRKPVMYSLDVLAKRFPKLIIWDPFPVLCKTEVCSVFEGGVPKFFDGDHLSAYGNMILYPSFAKIIETIWNQDQFSSAIIPGKSIPFNAKDVTFTGWSYPEKTHRWSSGKDSKIVFRVDNKDKFTGLLKLHIGTLGQQEIKVIINDKYLGSQNIDGWDKDIQFEFNPDILNKNQINVINFEFSNAHTPNDKDQRILAMALKSFMIE